MDKRIVGGLYEQRAMNYLLKNGFLNRTARGRVATQTAYEHLGIAFPE